MCNCQVRVNSVAHFQKGIKRAAYQATTEAHVVSTVLNCKAGDISAVQEPGTLISPCSCPRPGDPAPSLSP